MDTPLSPSRLSPRWPTPLIRRGDEDWFTPSLSPLSSRDIEAYDLPLLVDATLYYVREGRLYGGVNMVACPLGVWECDGWEREGGRGSHVIEGP